MQAGSEQPNSHAEIRVHWRGWTLVAAAALALAFASWLTNITSEAQVSGDADNFLAFRYTFSKLANSGTAWAGLAILCGWLVRRPLQAAAAGVLGSLLSLVAHYCLGRLSGIFDSTIWAENSFWFVASAIVCGPLGLLGAVARRFDIWGLVARMVVPLGAVLEPLVLRMFFPPAMLNWPQRFSSVASGIFLTGIGAACGAVIIAAELGRTKRRS